MNKVATPEEIQKINMQIAELEKKKSEIMAADQAQSTTPIAAPAPVVSPIPSVAPGQVMANKNQNILTVATTLSGFFRTLGIDEQDRDAQVMASSLMRIAMEDPNKIGEILDLLNHSLQELGKVLPTVATKFSETSADPMEVTTPTPVAAPVVSPESDIEQIRREQSAQPELTKTAGENPFEKKDEKSDDKKEDKGEEKKDDKKPAPFEKKDDKKEDKPEAKKEDKPEPKKEEKSEPKKESKPEPKHDEKSDIAGAKKAIDIIEKLLKDEQMDGEGAAHVANLQKALDDIKKFLFEEEGEMGAPGLEMKDPHKEDILKTGPAVPLPPAATKPELAKPEAPKLGLEKNLHPINAPKPSIGMEPKKVDLAKDLGDSKGKIAKLLSTASIEQIRELGRSVNVDELKSILANHPEAMSLVDSFSEGMIPPSELFTKLQAILDDGAAPSLGTSASKIVEAIGPGENEEFDKNIAQLASKIPEFLNGKDLSEYSGKNSDELFVELQPIATDYIMRYLPRLTPQLMSVDPKMIPHYKSAILGIITDYVVGQSDHADYPELSLDPLLKEIKEKPEPDGGDYPRIPGLTSVLKEAGKYGPAAKETIKHKMEKMKGEDKPQDQKVAIAIEEARGKGEKVPPKKAELNVHDRVWTKTAGESYEIDDEPGRIVAIANGKIIVDWGNTDLSEENPEDLIVANPVNADGTLFSAPPAAPEEEEVAQGMNAFTPTSQMVAKTLSTISFADTMAKHIKALSEEKKEADGSIVLSKEDFPFEIK